MPTALEPATSANPKPRTAPWRPAVHAVGDTNVARLGGTRHSACRRLTHSQRSNRR